jgi:glutamate N-acetyltransferase/amino-acid N-acetyltransferase
MEVSFTDIPSGSVTSPEGFFAGATAAGIKQGPNQPDLGILFSETPCAAGAVFTRNKIKAAPVLLSRTRLRDGRAQAAIINSGNANACTGRRGYRDAVRVTELTAASLGIPPEDVVAASTGLIGARLPLEKIQDSLDKIVLSRDGGNQLARAIMTTDTVPKATAVTVETATGNFVIGGIAKGSGMLHPDLATMLGFITTDAAVDGNFLKLALRRAVDGSFNMVSVDSDTSTNDTVLIMANGLAGNPPIDASSELASPFQQALERVCTFLAKCLARDGEGASQLIEVRVSGARSLLQARRAARTVVSSPLVKTAVHGHDPNWGRILAAVGRSGASLSPSKVDLDIGDMEVVRAGLPVSLHQERLERLLNRPEVLVNINLNVGTCGATAWGCDLSEEYVHFNSDYTT